MTSTRRRADEGGNIIVTLMVIIVATGFIIGTTLVVYSGQKANRRYGDSANALQLADAAVNDAVREVQTTLGQSLGPTTKTLGDAGSYTYSATLDPTTNVWHVDAWGIDKTGVKRHVKADAVPESLFSSAYFVDSKLNLPSGVALDSFTDGASLADTCTGKGVLGTNDPADLTFQSNGGNGNAQTNCTGLEFGNSIWPYPLDGCVAYHPSDSPPVWPPNYGTANHCPPQPYTQVADPLYDIPVVTAPQYLGNPVAEQSAAGTAGQSFPQVPCDATHKIQGGALYFVTQLVMYPGCQVNAANGPAIIYVQGNVTIGIQNGGSSTNVSPGINPPDTSNALLCPNYSGVDYFNNSRSTYCSGWSSDLQIYMTGTGSISFGNHANFWGAIMGNSATITSAPQVQMWGAMRVNGMNSSAQITLHYDEALGKVTNGVYTVKDWREEPT
jgi:hypothetical protein